MFKLIACVVATIGLFAGAAPAQADVTMSAQEILRLFPGTFQALVKGKYEVTVIIKRDGAIVGQVSGIEDHGRWTVRGTELCIVMPAMTRGRVECSAVVADNGWYRGRSVAFRKL